MASSLPITPAGGTTIPFNKYVAGITESFPINSKNRVIESSISSTHEVKYNPVNISSTNGINDRYLEYRIDGTSGTLINLNNLKLKLSIRFNRINAAEAAPAHIDLLNNFVNTIFKQITISFNGKTVESKMHYGVLSYIRTLKETDVQTINVCGGAGSLRDDANDLTHEYVAATFAEGTAARTRSEALFNGVTSMWSLSPDISSMDMYLIDNVDVNVRLELYDNRMIVNTHAPIDNLNLTLLSAELLVDKIVPFPNAMLALYESLKINPIEYMFTKTTAKTYVIGNAENTKSIDNPFGNCVPNKLTLAFLGMETFSGITTRNPLYFGNYDISNIHITVNSVTKYNYRINSNDYSQVFLGTQKAIGNHCKNMITYDKFLKGRGIFCFDFIAEDMPEVIPTDKSGHLKIELNFSENAPYPLLVLLIADTTGIISIDSERSIYLDTRG